MDNEKKTVETYPVQTLSLPAMLILLLVFLCNLKLAFLHRGFFFFEFYSKLEDEKVDAWKCQPVLVLLYTGSCYRHSPWYVVCGVAIKCLFSMCRALFLVKAEARKWLIPLNIWYVRAENL